MRPDRRSARAIAEDPHIRMQMKLLMAGMPFDVVDVLGEDELIGLCIVIGELEGGSFDWDSHQWKEPPPPS